ncbi:MAG: DegT/DnrJ/EryC1/StrS family aminotransferase [Phycisphaerae bacterium]|nr:DegT/DnrJ/EryC1/StrS family aminotransferase [Phycisphaerae bacterium]
MRADPLLGAPWPFFDEETIEASSRVLRSGRVNWWTGDECRAFEREWCERFGTAHALAMSNGSVSLEVALRALDVGPGDEVVVTPRSFVASAACVALVGAVPVFADIDERSQNLTAASIEAVLSPRTKAILPVHLAGWPCDMPAIMELAARRRLRVIEDCAQAHGATIDGRPVGTFGDFASWSFCQDKIMTTGGEGGLLATPDRELWRRAWSLSQHGKSWSASFEREHAPGFRWLVERFGSNHRMTEVQAAIGRVQLRRLDSWLEARRRNASALRSALAHSPALRVPWPSSREGHAFYRMNALVRTEALAAGWTRDRLLTTLEHAGVPCGVGVCPEIHRERAFVDAGFAPAAPLPVARRVGERSLAFLVHPTIDEATIERVGREIVRVTAAAVRADAANLADASHRRDAAAS